MRIVPLFSQTPETYGRPNRASAENLALRGILSETSAGLMKILAGCRNRLVHFYHEVSADELFEICSTELNDVISLKDEFRHWLGTHPELMDTAF